MSSIEFAIDFTVEQFISIYSQRSEDEHSAQSAHILEGKQYLTI